MKTLPAAPWAGVGIHLRTNQADPETLRRAAREVLDHPSYRTRAKEMAREFASCNAGRKAYLG